MSRTSFRQWFYAFTGDRKREAAALAKDAVVVHAPSADVAGAEPSEDLLAAAEHSVRAAHGDLGIELSRETGTSVAGVADIAAVEDIPHAETLVAETIENQPVENQSAEAK